ncbi:hypothetical protein D9615_008145 [Tricholomella constricta]|uniref:F-box domain-containing protein n=1 Tax=Tricholomella constricta TaxID=117010 RepID=A0A8H5GVD0_9AGAR|nr:hypothetical protein D9615_008145 [Tricholomella constricta]
MEIGLPTFGDRAQRTRDTRDHVQRTIAQQESELTRLQTILDTIQASHGVLKSRIEKLDSAIAPHKKLPPELLSIIFLYCAEPSLALRLRSRDGSEYARSMTLSLAAVCSSWRQVAISTPALWKHTVHGQRRLGDVTTPRILAREAGHVHVTGSPNQSHRLSDPPIQPPSSPSFDLGYKDALSAMKNMTSWGTRIIEIRANTIASSPIPFPVSLDPFLNLLFPYASQFRQITLSGFLHVLLPFITASPPAFNALESVSVQIDGQGSTSAFGTSPKPIEFAGLAARTVFQNAPQLREFILSGHIFFGNTTGIVLQTPLLSVFDLQWAELTRISVQRIAIDVANAHLIISQCARMTNCQLAINNAAVETPVDETQERIYHHYLLSLVVLLEESLVEALFQPLVLPSLEKLELGSSDDSFLFRGWENRSAVAGCTSLCNRSKCILRTLRAPFAIAESQLEGFLAEFSSLRELYLPHTWLSDTVMIWS